MAYHVNGDLLNDGVVVLLTELLDAGIVSRDLLREHFLEVRRLVGPRRQLA